MTEKSASQRAKARYEMKRKGKPRFGGYLTDEEKKLFTDTVALSPYETEKEMVIAAVAELHQKLNKKQPK